MVDVGHAGVVNNTKMKNISALLTKTRDLFVSQTDEEPEQEVSDVPKEDDNQVNGFPTMVFSEDESKSSGFVDQNNILLKK